MSHAIGSAGNFASSSGDSGNSHVNASPSGMPRPPSEAIRASSSRRRRVSRLFSSSWVTASEAGRATRSG
ncbi:MAG: hypothetical protein LBJ46_02145, partial [Planctomycetota bacterium]|nr:hypothetical protein [Planctomycetota bacterium]